MNTITHRTWTPVITIMAAGIMVFMNGCGPETPPTTGPTEPTYCSVPSTPVAVNDKLPPIVFVHGFRGVPDPNSPDDFLCPRSDAGAKAYAQDKLKGHEVLGNSYGDLPLYLTSKLGYRTHMAQYLSHPCYTVKYSEGVSELIDHIDRAKREANVDLNQKVILIAYSTGGIIARAYVEGDSPQPYRGDVAELFLVGAPFWGVNVNERYFAALSAPNSLHTQDYVLHQHLWENFSRLAPPPKAASGRNKDVRYHIIGGDLHDVEHKGTIKAKLLNFLGGSARTPNDGLIPQNSAMYLEGGTPLTTDDAHGDDYADAYSASPDNNYANVYYFACINNHAAEARKYIIDRLTEISEQSGAATPTPSSSVVTPFTPVTPVAQPTPPLPAPTCNKEEYALLMADYGIGLHVGEASGQYSRDCPGITPIDLAKVLSAQNIPISVTKIERNKGAVVALRDGLRTEIAGPGATALIEIPGSDIVTIGDDTYLIAPYTSTVRAGPIAGVDSMEVEIFKTQVDPVDGKFRGGAGKQQEIGQGEYEVLPGNDLDFKPKLRREELELRSVPQPANETERRVTLRGTEVVPSKREPQP